MKDGNTLGSLMLIGLLWIGPASAGTGPLDSIGLPHLRLRALAAVCAGCHGTDGRGVAGTLIPTLAGMPRDYMRGQFADFLDGNRPATVMPQIVKGLTPAQRDDLATYFARIPRLDGGAK